MEVFKHFSHHHALRPFTVREADEGFQACSGCERDLSPGSAYRCTKPRCEFFLHGSCFGLPEQLQHGSHPNHELKLLHPPPYPEKDFICNACGETSSAFCYHCSACTYDLHVGCAQLPHSVKRDDHPHPLALLFPSLVPETEDSDRVLTCSACYGSVTEQCWVYGCEQCNFNTHLDCAKEAADQPEPEHLGPGAISGEEAGGGREQEEASDHFASLMAAQNRLQLLQFQNRMSYQNAQFMMGLGSSLSRLA